MFRPIVCIFIFMTIVFMTIVKTAFSVEGPGKLDILGVSIGMTINQAIKRAELRGYKCHNREYLNQGVWCLTDHDDDLFFGSDKPTADDDLMADSGRIYPSDSSKDVVASVELQYYADRHRKADIGEIKRYFGIPKSAISGSEIKYMLRPNAKLTLLYDDQDQRLRIERIDLCVVGARTCPQEIIDFKCLRSIRKPDLTEDFKKHSEWLNALAKHPNMCR